MKKITKTLIATLMTAAISFTAMAAPAANDRVVVGTSIYAGWMPWYHIKSSGILDTVNKKYGTNVEVRTYATYDASFADYTGGSLDGVTLTNMDALLNPADAGIQSYALINGDASHGNDAIVAASPMQCTDLKGKKVYLVQGTVSQYLLNKYLETCGLDDTDVKMQNTTDAEIGNLFLNNEDPNLVVVTWNPVVQSIMTKPNAVKLFSSSEIEDQILDTMYVKTGLHPNVYKALNEAWYMAMERMTSRSVQKDEMIEEMASLSGSDVAGFVSQLKTTKFYVTQQQAKQFTESDKLKSVMKEVVEFVDSKDMMPNTKASKIGIQFPDGTVLGDKNNVKIIFTTEFMK